MPRRTGAAAQNEKGRSVLDEQAQKLLQGAIKAARSGDKALARKAFLQVLKLDPDNESAWLGLATVGQDKKEQLRALKRLLEMDPNNLKALEALRRMGVDPQRLLRSADSAPASPEAPISQAPAYEEPDIDDVPDWLSSATDPEESGPDLSAPAAPKPSLENTPMVRPIKSLRPLKPVESPSDMAADLERVMGDELPDTLSRPVDPPQDEAYRLSELDESQPPAADEPPSLEELVQQLTPQFDGTGGVPILRGESLQLLAEQALELSQSEREDLLDGAATVQWVRKSARRAGENEMRTYQIQVFSAIAVAVFVFGAAAVAALLNVPGVQRVVFAPTWTPSPTFTLTPTSTPGVTPTPSVTPELTLTPSPTIPATVTPGRRDVQPEPTNIYVPVGVARERGIVQAADLINRGQLEEAFPILERERMGTANSGSFLPYHYLSLLHLAQNDISTAREVLIEGEALWQERGRDVPFEPMINASFARVDLREAEDFIRADSPNQARPLLAEATDRLLTALTEDQSYVEAHVLLAWRYELEADYEEALRVLQEAQINPASAALYTDTTIRLAQARIYETQERYDDTLQTLNELLYIDPYNDQALQMQVAVALAKGDPGLGVIFAEQYLFYYPGRVEGFKLLADARLAEGKTDLALNEYARALLGDESEPAYIEVLQGRASIYLSQRRYAQAVADLTEALRLSDEDPAVRVQRMQAAYPSGNYSVAQSDAAALSGDSSIPASELDLLRARILVDQDRDPEQALTLLEGAISQGLPSSSQPIANEYLAWALYRLERYDDALERINQSLNASETGSGRYLRAQILEARGNAAEEPDLDDLRAALLDYEFILTWSRVFPYDYADEALQRYQALSGRIEALSSST